MQYLAEATAATLKGCGDALSLQPKPRENQKHCSVNVWSEVHVCLFVLPEFFVILRCQELKW